MPSGCTQTTLPPLPGMPKFTLNSVHPPADVERIARETTLTPAAHLTCVEASRDEIDDIARAYWAAGVRHIVALRGDPPEAGAKFEPPAGGYANAAELVEGIKQVASFALERLRIPPTGTRPPGLRLKTR